MMLPMFVLLCLLPNLILSATSSTNHCNTSELHCGNQSIQLQHPFIEEGTNGSCTPNITCFESKYPIIEINSLRYHVKSIDYSDQTLVITNLDFLFIQRSCTPPKINTSWDITPFSYTEDDELLMLLYNCTLHYGSSDEGVFELPCPRGFVEGIYYNYYATKDPMAGKSECTTVIHAAVSQSTMEQVMKSNGSEEERALVLDALEEGFTVTWASQDWRCEGCEKSGGQCLDYWVPRSEGFCRCPDKLSYRDKCPTGGNKGKTLTKIIAAGVLAAVTFLLLCLALLCFLFPATMKSSVLCGKRKSRKDQKLDEFLQRFGPLAPKRYSYSNVEKMTSSFSDKLGQGGYGGVYKGKLHDGCLVAVKVLNSSEGNGKEFFNEVISIASTYHVNIVSLIGFCLEDSHRILIYEYMPNGSLEKFIYTERQTGPILKWEKLLEIATGIARGLDYLHHGCNIGILHFDIKPHNILLDQDFCPKISDFGLAKLSRSEELVLSRLGARGTVGYIAPEVFLHNFGGVSSKSDVYSYGMMLLEMVGGRKSDAVNSGDTSEVFYPHWIYKHLNLDGDLRSFRPMTEMEENIAKRMILVGLWCIQTKPMDRPSMSRVVDMLEGRVVDLQMPPMPVLFPS